MKENIIKNIKVISVVDIICALGDFISFMFAWIGAVVSFITSPFSIEKKDEKIVFSASFKPIPKVGKICKSIVDFISIRKILNGDYVIRIKSRKLGYICLHPIPTSKSGVYAYASPNGYTYTATWYAGSDEKERTASAWIKKQYGHNFNLTQAELAKISLFRQRLDALLNAEDNGIDFTRLIEAKEAV